jgi:hypothetical protein
LIAAFFTRAEIGRNETISAHRVVLAVRLASSIAVLESLERPTLPNLRYAAASRRSEVSESLVVMKENTMMGNPVKLARLFLPLASLVLAGSLMAASIPEYQAPQPPAPDNTKKNKDQTSPTSDQQEMNVSTVKEKTSWKRR